MFRWKIFPKSEYSAADCGNIHPVVFNLLSRRGLKNSEEMNNFISPSYERDVFDPFLFSDMKKVIERIKKSKDEKEKICIFGDYDADGITSAIIIKETLELLGLFADIYIPDKKTEGYGMNIAAIEKFAKDEVKLIITVDCGITNVKEVERANELGMDVIITDHHHIPENLPEAYAIINPKMKNSNYPFLELAGVGVAFKVAQAIFEKLLPGKKEQTKWMLDLVAIGTIADCVPLVGENRLFVKYGLLVLSKTKRIGLRELFNVGRMKIDENNVPSERNVSFHIAPRINAAGRINHANLAYNLIVENSVVKARDFALELESHNSSRQKITETIVNEVKILAENMFKDKKFIFAVGENFSIGVVGLVAGKIAQQFNKPTAVIQKGEKESKGSFRSIPQIDIIEIISRCGDLLHKYGGHSQAAGITIANENLEAFYEKMNLEIEKELVGKDISPELEIEAEIKSQDIDFSLTDFLEKIKPFGVGNPEPIFSMNNLTVEDIRTVGSGEKHLKLSLRSQDNDQKIFDTIGFYMTESFAHVKRGDVVDVAFNLQKDEWNGNKKTQLLLVDIKKQ
ncbi:MAG: hypothetical protein ACD_11C00021G0020 [uncultured bacterium]|nr:MAG: hypothetical protein ACD_11C00021G0020 [uncultured bacterium]HBR71819.1 single-stranded-DNA-specific exonuclease RecJ [Candidatus Moranbacteria bacterium]